jgi:uncharacterized protein YhfF
MERLKRTQFWGKDENDDRLILQIIAGKKTATVCPSEIYSLPEGDYEDGGFVKGDIVEVYDLKERLRCIIKITEVYETAFGDIPEKLWKGECNNSEEEFKDDHISCWSEYSVTDGFRITANHFELVEKQT